MFFFYNLLINLFFPIYILVILVRKYLGKEDRERFIEKIESTDNFSYLGNDKKLLWFHGASLGEITSVIPLIEKMLKEKSINILITSTTLSSGELVKKKFKTKNNVFHQYLPYDKNNLIIKFLDYWNPCAAVFIDSEIWPNFFKEIQLRNISLILLNGRISDKATKRWLFFRRFSFKVFSIIDLCLASNKKSLKNLKKLGVKKLKYFGNLKFIPAPLIKHNPKDLLSSIKRRKVWCAAITHSGEENVCLKTHKKLIEEYKNLLLIIIPRHINRIKEIEHECKISNLNFQKYNLMKKISVKKNTKVLLIDSFGQLQRLYGYCKNVFIGKSLLKKFYKSGGQNPMEAIYSGCKVYHGPYVSNFEELYEYLNKNMFAIKVKDSDDLFEKLLKNLDKSKLMSNQKLKKVEKNGKKILMSSLRELYRYIK